MQIIPNTRSQPRLTNSIEVPLSPRGEGDEASLNAHLKRTGFIVGNGRAIFVGLAISAIIMSAMGLLGSRYSRTQAAPEPKLLAVETNAVSGAAHRAELPTPVMVQVTEDMLRVSAISLGQPRLAVINGAQVAEGDFIAVHSPVARSVVVNLRVLHIGDGRIELTDGTQRIQAHLAVARLKAGATSLETTGDW
jgi:hypothetical protein